MGQIVRRKRRGRPSNTDRARSNFYAAPPSPVDRLRSRRRRNVRYNFDIDDYVDDDEFYNDEDEEVGRREKKLRLLLREDDSRSNRRVTHAPSSSSSDGDDEDDDDKPSKRRKVNGGDRVDDEDNEIEEIRGRKLEEEEEEEEADGGPDFVRGRASDLPKGVSLPDKKTLELILDKLQKKDIYGVYAEPVDPEELPDYHDVIKHPMDFATVRKKLAKGSYLTLKEFESDVLLICTNAMQYNAPDTIYYKQASSIQEQAKLKFQRLKANVDLTEIEPQSEPKTTPSFSLPKKQLKKSVALTAQDPVDFETTYNGSSAQTPVRSNSGEVLIAENSSLADNNQDKEQELLPGKGFVPKLGRKPSVHDENRRATYNTSDQPVTESSSIFSTFEGESKQFIPVGLHADHSYSRSLARFAATLGSVAWKVASQKIIQSLPEGVKFGRGWVGEYEPLPTPVLIPGNCTLKEPNFLAPFQINSTFAGSNLLHQNPSSRNFTKPGMEGSLRVELNHPPPTRPISSASDIPSPRPAKPVSRNGKLASLASFKHPFNNVSISGRQSNRELTPVGLDCNRMVLMDHNLTHQQEKQGLSKNPVQMMEMLAEKVRHQQNNSNGFGFGPKREDSNNAASTIPQIYSNCSQIDPKRDNSTNVALSAAQAWMSLGGAGGGFIRPPLADSARQPQVSRFPGVQFQPDKNTYQQPVHAFIPQPVRTINEPHLQNRHVGFPRLVTPDLSRFQVQPSWRGVTPQMQQQARPKQQESRPPDLNIGYQSMGSPVRQSTGMLVDSQQPDLALQL